MKEPLRSLCKCPVENGDTTPTSTDNSNTSSALRLSERIRSQRTRKIYQGQPRRLVILGATFTTAKLYFEQVGQPSYYNVVLTTNNSADKNTTNERHTYQFTYTQYIHYGNYLLVTGLTPNTVYTVELYVTYESGDVFPVNHTKQFRTSVAEGAVKKVVLKNPTNQTFPVESGDVNSQRTSFTLEFTPLRDHVDYRISIPGLLYIANISYDTITNEYPLLYSKSFDASYNTTYTAIVETLYGSGGDQYTFDTSASITTLNENYFLQSNLTVDTIFNSSILLSYTPVDTIEGIQHNFYVNGVKHGNIERLNNNRITILDLMINTTYTLAISTVFPDSHNEYIDNVNKLTLTTLNESGVTFLYNENSPIIRNTSVDFLYEAPSGTSFTVIPSIEPDHGTIHLDSVNQILSITGLSINTTYLVSLDASYGSTNNNYSVQEYFTTLNQGPVTNLQVTEIVKVRSDAIVTFTGAPSEASLSMKPYYLVQFGDNPEITVQYNANTSTKGVKFTELSNIVYEYSVKSVYPPITTVEPTIPSYTYTVSGDIEIQTTSVGNLTPMFGIRGDSISIRKYAATGFTNHTYYSVRFDEVISDGTNTTREAYFQDRIYDWDDSLLILDLLPDTSYNYRIEGYYDFDNFSSNNVGTLRTLNESKTTITNMTIGVNSVSITTSNRTGNGSILSMRFKLNENVEQHFSPVTTFMKNDLLANTFYQLQITNRYNDNLYDYNYDTGFTTLHAGPGTLNGLFVFDHPVYGNSAILTIDNINPNEVNYNIVELQYTDGTPDISYVVSTNETIQIPNVVFNQDIRATLHTYYRDKISTGLIDFQYELPYYSTNEYNFQAVMPEFISIVKNDSIELRWLDLDTTVDISYTIQWLDTSRNIYHDVTLDFDSNYYDISGLERNTIYDISFIRLSDPPNTQFKSLRTLNEGPVDTLANSIVLNTGMGGNTVVLDLENSISTPNIVENRFVFDNAPDATISTSQTNIIDVTLPDGSAEGDTLSGTIRTIYKPIPIQLTSPYVLYSTPVDGYISDSLTFTVEQMKTPTVLLNGTLDPSNGETYVFSDTTGMTSTSSTVYPEHYNTNAVLLVDNSNGTLYGHNYLDRAHVNQHALFYVDYPVSQPAYLEQSISGEYLFRNYYSLAFFIAKHLAENNPYGNISELPYRGSGTTAPTVEYKAQLVDNQGVLFQTNPLISYDQSWNQIQVKFYLANSSKNVKLRIQRNYYELNHLLLSDISMVAMGAEFQPIPSIRHNVDTWNTTSFGTSVDISWNQFYGESILQLSTNMSLGFWLYVHPLTQNLTETVFLLVGESTATVHQDNVLSFYIKKNRIYIENQSHSYAFKRHSIYNAYREKIPIYYQVVYTNGDVIVYENGHRLQQYKPDTFLKEAVRTQNIYLGEPSLSSERFGPIVRDVCFYNFPFTDKQVLNVYNDLRAPYSSFGNYTDILPDEKFNINNSVNANTMTFINDTVQYELHNGTSLQKVLSFTPMEGQIVEWDASMTLPFSIGFWYKPDPKMRTVDETLVSLDSSTGESLVMLRQNGSSLHFSGTIFTNKTVPWRPPIKSVEHILCTVNSNGEIELYKNGYLYYSNVVITTTPITPDESPTELDISRIELGSPQYRSQLADLQIFSKALDQAEVFTAYMNYYRIMVQYNIATGIYTVQIPQVAGSEVNTTVNYTITNTTISSFNVPLQGTITLVDDDLTAFDISMSSFERNQLHKNNDSFQLTIEDYGISTVIQGGANPYIDAVYVTNSYVEEGGTITITLNNVPVSDPIVQYPYELRGLGITEKDISGESLTGILEPNSSTDIIVRKDYKTEDQESLIIAIDSLFISTVVDISDTTVNLLSIDNDKPKSGETFVITLTWPEPTTLPDVITYKLVNDQNELSNYVLPNIGTFDKKKLNDNEYKYSQLFDVNNNAPPQERVTMKLVNYDSTIEIVLNDFIEPRIRLHKLNEPNTDVINEGETFVVIMELPLTWNSQSDFSYNIITTSTGGLADFNSSDISTNNDPSFDLTAMSGQFSFDLANNIRDISYNFVTTTNRVPEQDEEIIVQLTSDGYTDISSNILTIINSAKAPRYSLDISGLTKNTGESFYSVNEGDIFTITLIGVNALIESAQYRISGITLADISVDVGTLSQNDSGDIVSTMNIKETKTFTINLDESTETDEMFTFTIDELTLSETFKIVDTSVAPAYVITSTTDSDTDTITIQFKNTNFSLMTESQKSMMLSYHLSGDLVIVGQEKDKDIYFQIKESDSVDVTFTYIGTGTLIVRAFGITRPPITIG